MNYIEEGKKVIATEIQGLQFLSNNLDESFSQIIELIQYTKNNGGHVIITGMGKSGIIGEKISATLSSLGIPSFFLHPAEASHGDLGRIAKNDVVIIISNSGNTDEIVFICPKIIEMGIKTILVTGNSESKLSKCCDYVLNIGNLKEVDEHIKAPMTTTTATLVLGDAIAVVLSKLAGFTRDDFIRFHPGGYLGKHVENNEHMK